MRGWLAAGLVLVSACPSAPSDEGGAGTPAPYRTFGAEKNFGGLAWSDRDHLVLAALSSPTPEAPPWVLDVETGDAAEVRLPVPERCRATEHFGPSRLPDGGLAVVRRCYLEREAGEVQDEIMRLDASAGRVEPLLPDPPFSPSTMTWNPSMTRALIGRNSFICATLVWADDEGYEYAELTVPAGGVIYQVDRSLMKDECDGPKADWPAWSPDGERIAFFFSHQSVGVKGFDRLDVPSDLYLMRPDGSGAEPLLTDVWGPASPVWSPDGDRLAFSGETEDGEGRTWVVDVASGAVRQIYHRRAESLDWRPDEEMVAGLFSPETGPSTVVLIPTA
jgi:hypothetical protein